MNQLKLNNNNDIYRLELIIMSAFHELASILNGFQLDEFPIITCCLAKFQISFGQDIIYEF